jgi:hypothetical protein
MGANFMRIVKSAVAPVSLAYALAACGIVPDIPRENRLPIAEIVLSASCGLKFALEYLDQPEFGRFKARNWLINIVVLPKTDTDVQLGAGYNGKSSSVAVPYLSSWVVGSGPGLNVDTKGERSSGVTYKIKSVDLIKAKHLDCYNSKPTFHALINNLGLQDWLVRSAVALNVNPIAKVDSPSYNSEITIKFSGDGSYSYAFPFGGAFAAASGSYSVDEQLQISMTPLEPSPKPFHVTTLPVDNLRSVASNNASVSATAAATQRLDFLQLQNTLRSLKSIQ